VTEIAGLGDSDDPAGSEQRLRTAEAAARIEARLRALDLARASTDPATRDRDAALLGDLGMDHADAGEWETAISYFEEALEARERIGDEARVEEARSTLDWARGQFAEQDGAEGWAEDQDMP